MDKEMHIIFTVDIAGLAVTVCWIFGLVCYHSILGVEVLEAIFVGTFDLHLDGNEEEGRRVRDLKSRNQNREVKIESRKAELSKIEWRRRNNGRSEERKSESLKWTVKVKGSD